MNRYHWSMNLLVVLVLAFGLIFALPNFYGTEPAIQVVSDAEEAIDDTQLQAWLAALGTAEIKPQEAFLDDGRAMLRFDSIETQLQARDVIDAQTDESVTTSLTLASRSPGWVRNIGLKPMSLGLDLRGGVYFLFEVDMEEALNKRLKIYEQDFARALSKAGIARRVRLQDSGVIRVQVREAAELDRARKIVENVDPDLSVTGSDSRTLTVRLTEQQIRERQDLAIEQNVTTLRNRVNELGVAEPLVQRQGLNRIVVQLPGVQDPKEADDVLNATATLEFRLTDRQGDTPGAQAYPMRGGGQVRLLRDVVASGDQIVAASAGFSQGAPAVNIRLDSLGGERMLETTSRNVGQPMATLFIETKRRPANNEQGWETYTVSEVVNDATIQGVFSNSFQITGLSASEARSLALILRAGSLAAPIFKVEERTIGPSLGKDNIDRGFKAVVIGFLAVVVFMALYYRVFGIIADLALLANLVMIIALLSIFQAALTLPGIAGIVLTVGMAVDANVLIFERIREELAAGSQPQQAIFSGYEKALSSIADANITTLIAAFVLFAFGTGPIRGFAITLAFGIMTSMFTAIVGTRSVVNALFGQRKLKELPV